MTNYTFVRFTINQAKDTFAALPESLKQHNDYVKTLVSTGNVITEASLGDDEGGILVMKGDISIDVINRDPAVQQNVVTAEMKKLYIAKGSFCEK